MSRQDILNIVEEYIKDRFLSVDLTRALDEHYKLVLDAIEAEYEEAIREEKEYKEYYIKLLIEKGIPFEEDDE